MGDNSRFVSQEISPRDRIVSIHRSRDGYQKFCQLEGINEHSYVLKGADSPFPESTVYVLHMEQLYKIWIREKNLIYGYYGYEISLISGYNLKSVAFVQRILERESQLNL